MNPATEACPLPAPLAHGVDLLAGYRRLAIRVIELALRDLDCASPELRQSARTFLTHDPLLVLWCDLAEIRPARVRARAATGPILSRRAGPRAHPGDVNGVQAPEAVAKLASARSSVS